MSNLSYLVVHKFRAWQHHDSVLLETEDLEEAVECAVEEEIRLTGLIMFDGPSLGLYISRDGKQVGEIGYIPPNKDQLKLLIKSEICKNHEPKEFRYINDSGKEITLTVIKDRKKSNSEIQKIESFNIGELRDGTFGVKGDKEYIHHDVDNIKRESGKLNNLILGELHSGHNTFCTYHADPESIHKSLERIIEVFRKMDIDKNVYHGKFLNVVKRHKDDIEREIVLTGDAVACMVLNKDKTKTVLVKQERLAVKGPDKNTWEIPAGILDVEGESKEQCLIREVKEETGLTISNLEFICNPYSMIGCSNSRVAIYTAEAVEKNVKFKDTDVTEAKWFTLEEVEEMINNDIIKDNKTILAYYKIKSELNLK